MPLGRPWAFERGTLWALELDDTAPVAPVPYPPAVTLSEVLPGDVAALAALAVAMGVPDPRTVSERMVTGRRCFAASVEGEIAAYGWVSHATEHIGELERTMVMLPDEAYIWDCATLPAFRRRGLYSALLRHIVSVLRDERLRRLWIGASLANAPSIRGFRSAGFLPAITLTYLRVLGLRRIWLGGDATAPPTLVAGARRALTNGRELPQAAVTLSRTSSAPPREVGAEES